MFASLAKATTIKGWHVEDCYHHSAPANAKGALFNGYNGRKLDFHLGVSFVGWTGRASRAGWYPRANLSSTGEYERTPHFCWRPAFGQTKTTVYLTDFQNYAEMNKAYREFFPTKPPARATIKVELLDPKFLVENDAIAVVDYDMHAQ
jgi:hypothetical protein